MAPLGTTAFSVSPVIKELLNYRGEKVNSTWASVALRSLVKKKLSGEALLSAIMTQDQLSACIVASTGPNDFIHILGRKWKLHVASCKMFRWPDLDGSRELQPLENCIYSFLAKDDEVCINPFHYKLTTRCSNNSTSSVLSGLLSLTPNPNVRNYMQRLNPSRFGLGESSSEDEEIEDEFYSDGSSDSEDSVSVFSHNDGIGENENVSGMTVEPQRTVSSGSDEYFTPPDNGKKSETANACTGSSENGDFVKTCGQSSKGAIPKYSREYRRPAEFVVTSRLYSDREEFSKTRKLLHFEEQAFSLSVRKTSSVEKENLPPAVRKAASRTEMTVSALPSRDRVAICDHGLFDHACDDDGGFWRIPMEFRHSRVPRHMPTKMTALSQTGKYEHSAKRNDFSKLKNPDLLFISPDRKALYCPEKNIEKRYHLALEETYTLSREKKKNGPTLKGSSTPRVNRSVPTKICSTFADILNNRKPRAVKYDPSTPRKIDTSTHNDFSTPRRTDTSTQNDFSTPRRTDTSTERDFPTPRRTDTSTQNDTSTPTRTDTSTERDFSASRITDPSSESDFSAPRTTTDASSESDLTTPRRSDTSTESDLSTPRRTDTPSRNDFSTPWKTDTSPEEMVPSFADFMKESRNLGRQKQEVSPSKVKETNSVEILKKGGNQRMSQKDTFEPREEDVMNAGTAKNSRDRRPTVKDTAKVNSLLTLDTAMPEERSPPSKTEICSGLESTDCLSKKNPTDIATDMNTLSIDRKGLSLTNPELKTPLPKNIEQKAPSPKNTERKRKALSPQNTEWKAPSPKKCTYTRLLKPQPASLPKENIIPRIRKTKSNHLQTKKEAWACISYYEMMNQEGLNFYARDESVIIDGHCNTDDEDLPARYSLFDFGSECCRDPTIEYTRRLIGEGVRLHYSHGDVYATCLSESPVFLHSYITNHGADLHPERVLSLANGDTVQVFSRQKFDAILGERFKQGHRALLSAGEFCNAYISFEKGWGAGYQHTEIINNPCWLRICFYEPLLKLNHFLSDIRKCHFESVQPSSIQT